MSTASRRKRSAKLGHDVDMLWKIALMIQNVVAASSGVAVEN
jgi:hypothetical protein